MTSESVSAGHPDKLCDAISDSILDACIELDPFARVAVESMVKGMADESTIVLAGEVTLNEGHELDFEEIARKTAIRIGYDDQSVGMDASGDSCNVITLIGRQSPEIAQGVNIGAQRVFKIEPAIGVRVGKILLYDPSDQMFTVGWAASSYKPGTAPQYNAALEPFYEKTDAEFLSLRATARDVLQKEDELNEIVQLVGKDSLAESDKITLETAKFLKEDFLQQNSFTAYDKYCPFYKSAAMLRNILAFHRAANAAVERTAGGEGAKITFNVIKARMGDLMYRVASQKFEDPAEGEEKVTKTLAVLHDDLLASFRQLEDEFR